MTNRKNKTKSYDDGFVYERGGVYWIAFSHQGHRVREAVKDKNGNRIRVPNQAAAARQLKKRVAGLRAGGDLISPSMVRNKDFEIDPKEWVRDYCMTGPGVEEAVTTQTRLWKSFLTWETHVFGRLILTGRAWRNWMKQHFKIENPGLRNARYIGIVPVSPDKDFE